MKVTKGSFSMRKQLHTYLGAETILYSIVKRESKLFALFNEEHRLGQRKVRRNML